jgi:hypothetical protein
MRPNRGSDPFAQIPPRLVACSLGTTRVEDHRLQDPEHELDQLVELVLSMIRVFADELGVALQ